jgi:deaminated glutathione amidase
MKIAAIQMVSTPDVSHNLQTARRLLEQAAKAGARLAVLPEYFGLMGAHEQDKLHHAESPSEGPMQHMLASTARELGLWVVGGTVPLRSSNLDHVFNSCLVYDPAGQLAARYDKMYLFSFSHAGEHYNEAATIAPGQVAVAVQAGALRVGLSVCYDLRFPELYRQLMHPPCDLIALPAAFIYTTGLAHWEVLLRARAIENQCYVVAAAQGGLHLNGRRTFGHSMVIDPWGRVLGALPEGEGVVLASVDLERMTAVRAQLPALAHRLRK